MRAPIRIAALCLLALPAFATASEALERQIDSLFSAFDVEGSPGVTVGVYKEGRPVYVKGHGAAHLEFPARLDSRTPMHIASVSKQFTAFAIALLAQEGRLGLDDDVRRYLPYVPDFGHKISLRQLIHHTSGLRDQWDLLELAGHDLRDLLQQQQILNLVSQQATLNFAPGEQYMYSNTGYTLLAEVVHAVTGQTLREFTSARIFGPLGMKDTFFNDNVEQVIAGRAESYRPLPDGRWERAVLSYDTVGATSLMTTVDDLARWAENFFTPTVGRRALIQQLDQPAVTNDGASVNYGYGLLNLSLAGHRAVVHTGSDAGFRSFFAVFPAEHLTVILLSNASANVDESAEAIAALMFDVPGPTRTKNVANKSSPRLPSAAVTGDYIGPWGQLVSIRLGANGTLQWQPMMRRAQELYPGIDSTWDTGARTYGYYRMRRGDDGRVQQFEEVSILDPQHPTIYRRAEVAHPTAAELQQLSGDYRSPELDTTYRLSVEQGELVARPMHGAVVMRFKPTERDRFLSTRGAIRIKRDAGQRPVGFELSWDRVWNVAFQRVSPD